MSGKVVTAITAAILLMAPTGLMGLQAPQKRAITLGVRAESAVKESRITAVEDGSASIIVPEVGQFAFSPHFRKGDEKLIVVTISDPSSSPSRELGQVDAPVSGAPVRSKTKPLFELRVINVTTPKK